MIDKIIENLLLERNAEKVTVEYTTDEAIKEHKEQCDFLIALLEKEKTNGWIACSERLPEKNDMYLCTQNTYDLATNKKIIKVSTELVEFYNGKWRRAKNLVITHWQPLPQPYKESEHNG